MTHFVENFLQSKLPVFTDHSLESYNYSSPSMVFHSSLMYFPFLRFHIDFSSFPELKFSVFLFSFVFGSP